MTDWWGGELVERSDGEEGQLLAALAAGDREAAERLVERTYRSVFALVRRLCGDSDLAADLTQETYRKAWSSLASFDGRAKFSTWLCRIAYNTFLNHVRRPQRVQPLTEEARFDPPDPAPDQEERLQRDEVRARLRRAVVGLPEQLRFTVTARFWAELPVEEIARAESVTGAAIRKRLDKAMRFLRTALQEDAA